ncbi:MAG: ABC transporter substrate-binding protein [Andreesenia angusta]|nr:ABC transporter substrate-binding protein [Andreesenia angusta]
MRRNLGVFFIIVFLFISSYIVEGIGQRNGNKTIKIGFFPNITHGPALVAKHRRSFEEKLGPDISVEWIQFNDGPAVMEALFAKEIDLSYIGPGPGNTAYIKSNGEIKTLAGSTNGGAIILASKASGIKELKDLPGRTVSIPKAGSTQEVTLRGLLEENKLGEVEFIPAKNSDVQNLIAKNEVDAAFITEPWGSLIEEADIANLVLDNDKSYKEGNYPTTVLIGRQEYIDKEKEIVKTIIEENKEIIKDINDDKEKAKKDISVELEAITGKKISDKVLTKAFNRMKFTDEVKREDLKEMIDIFSKAGFGESNDMKNIIWKED